MDLLELSSGTEVLGRHHLFLFSLHLASWALGGTFLTFAIYLASVACLALVFPCRYAPPNPPSLASPLPKQLLPCHTQWATLTGTDFPVGGLSLNQHAPQSSSGPRWGESCPPGHPQQLWLGLEASYARDQPWPPDLQKS